MHLLPFAHTALHIYNLITKKKGGVYCTAAIENSCGITDYALYIFTSQFTIRLSFPFPGAFLRVRYPVYLLRPLPAFFCSANSENIM